MMNLFSLKVRLVRAQFAILMLGMLLQRSPAVRVLVVLEKALSQPFSQVVKLTTYVATTMGVFHATAGATQFNTAPGNSPFEAEVGVELAISFTVTGAPKVASRWEIQGSLPPGLTMTSDTNGTLVDGMIDGNIISVQGLPTMDGTYVFNAKAFNDKGDTDNNRYEVQINVSASTFPQGPPVIRNVRWGGSGIVGDLQLSAGVTYRIDYSTNAKDWSPMTVEFVANQPTLNYTSNSNQILSGINLGDQLGFYSLVEESP